MTEFVLTMTATWPGAFAFIALLAFIFSMACGVGLLVMWVGLMVCDFRCMNPPHLK